jgi:hypothetical protein
LLAPAGLCCYFSRSSLMIHNISLARTGSPWWLVELGGESFASVIEILKLEMRHRTRQFDFAS